jgi:hypothetical protein
MGRIVYNLYVVGEFGEKSIMETENISDILSRVEAIARKIESLDIFLAGFSNIVDIQEFRITISRVGEERGE